MRTARLAGLATALVMTVLVSLMSAPAPSARAATTEASWGSVNAKNAVLKRGCRNYSYRYVVDAPTKGDWDLSVRIMRKGRVVWFGYLYEGPSPEAGVARFRLCSSQVRPGRYRLEAVVSVQDGREVTESELPVDTFKLRKPRRRR